MFNKRFTVYFLFMFIFISLITFYVYAHWHPDPGPDLIEGDENNLAVTRGHEVDDTHFWKKWEVDETVKDVKNNDSLIAKIDHKKEDHYGFIPNVKGRAYCFVWSAAKIKCAFTRGKYEVRAQARGLLWYKTDKKKNIFFGGVTA